MLLALIFGFIHLSTAQTLSLNLAPDKTLIFEYEQQGEFIHLKSFKSKPERLKLSYSEIQNLVKNYKITTQLEADTLRLIEQSFPVDETLEPYTSVTPLKWTEICERIGQDQPAEYSDINNDIFKSIERVGVKKSRCFGRCGFGCGVPFDNKNRYTQECLNHDACSRELGENMGPCKDEYWAAADGYLNSKICEKKPK